MRENILSDLPADVQHKVLLFFSFASLQPFFFSLFYSHRYFSHFEEVFQVMLSQNFSGYFREGELKEYKGQDLKALISICILYPQFSAKIHLHKTPYYYRLLNQTIHAFLARKQEEFKEDNSLRHFPWLAYIRGQISRVMDKPKAADYFTVAIDAKPTLPLAQLAMAITYSAKEFEELKIKTPVYKDEKSGHCLPIAAIRDDFILRYLKMQHVHRSTELIYDLYRQGSAVRFNFLVQNYEYTLILKEFSSFQQQKIITKTKMQLVDGWVEQMRITQAPEVVSHLAAGLLRACITGGIFPSPLSDEQNAALDVIISECLIKGGYDHYLLKYPSLLEYPSLQKRNHSILTSIVNKEIPVRPGYLGSCWQFLGLNDSYELSRPSYFRAIKEGWPALYYWVHNVILTGEHNDNISQRQVRDIFQMIFVCQCLCKAEWLENIDSSLSESANKYKKERRIDSLNFLFQLSKSTHINIKVPALIALGFSSLCWGDYGNASQYFKLATEETSYRQCFKEYFRFLKAQRCFLTMEDRKFLAPYLRHFNLELNIHKNKMSFLQSPPPSVSASTSSSSSSCSLS